VFLVNHGYTWPQGQTRLMIRPLYWDAQGWPTLDSTKGVIMAPAVSIRPAVAPSQRAPARFRRPPESFLIPWNGGARDVRGRRVPPRHLGTPALGAGTR
jgi:hypothetical protein